MDYSQINFFNQQKELLARAEKAEAERDALKGEYCQGWNVGFKAGLKDCAKAVERAEQAEAELVEIREAHAKVMAEQCPSDEKHCTCVPMLRAEVERLKEALNRGVMALRGVAALSYFREHFPGITSRLDEVAAYMICKKEGK